MGGIGDPHGESRSKRQFRRLWASMYLGQFLIGMSATTVIVAVWTYMATGSFWKALGWTIAVLIVLQAGYFVLVMRLIYSRARKAASRGKIDTVPPLHGDGATGMDQQ